jgi:protein-L-isoaspartate(D-aspartate) O-methyltransferase
MTDRLDGIGMTSQRTRSRMIERLRAQGIVAEDVLDVMYEVPRHIFVDDALASRAYDDTALPIGFGQSISHPYTVARMTELVCAVRRPLGKVLEIGSGCGYQTAILARLAKEVYSIERLLPLVTKARGHLRELRIRNVRLRHGDGHGGIPELGPFDAILVTAAASHIPDSLKEQLGPNARMVVPMGTRRQNLCVIQRSARGFVQWMLDGVKFVPLLSGLS